MIAPGHYNIDNLYTNSDWRLQVTLKDEAGDPVDLTGYSFFASIWNNQKTTKYVDITVTVLNAGLGEIELSLTSEETADLNMSNGYIGFWDLLAEQPDGAAYYWLRGDVYLTVGGSSKDG